MLQTFGNLGILYGGGDDDDRRRHGATLHTVILTPLTQIAGLVSTSVAEGSDKEASVLRGMLEHVRRHPLFQNCPLLLVTESVATIDGSRYAAMFRGDPLVYAFRGSGPGKLRPGVAKAPANEMTHLFQHYLAMGSVRYAKDLFTYDRPAKGKDTETGRLGACPLLELQLQNWQWHRDPRGISDPKLHGKVGGEQDDLLITLLMVSYWASVMRQSTRPADVDWKRQNKMM